MSLILSGTDGVADVDGSAATPAIRGTDANTGIFFPAADTIAFSEGGAEVARFDSAGNFGVGTSSPSTKLQVAGVAYSSTGGLAVGDGSSFTPSGLSSIPNYGVGFTTTGSITSVTGFGGINFYTAQIERIRIDQSGNFLVGTTTAANGRQMLAFDNAGQSGIRILHSSTTYNGQAMAFLRADNSTLMGSIYCDGSNTAYNTSSDYRLKENIAPMTGALNRVALLKPVTYKWKDLGKTGEGFIAHELQEVVPDAVHGEKDAIDADGNPVHQGIDTSFLVATLTAALQEAHGLITALTTRVEALEGAQP